MEIVRPPRILGNKVIDTILEYIAMMPKTAIIYTDDLRLPKDAVCIDKELEKICLVIKEDTINVYYRNHSMYDVFRGKKYWFLYVLKKNLVF